MVCINYQRPNTWDALLCICFMTFYHIFGDLWPLTCKRNQGDAMIVAGRFWGWCLFARRKVCERSRSGQSHNKSSSKRSTELTSFKAPSKGMELRIFSQQGCFGDFANGIREIVVISINSWTLCWATQCSRRPVYQTNWNSILNAYCHRL